MHETSVWYATENRRQSTSKFIVFDDKGILQLHDGGLLFSGNKQQVNLTGIRNVDLVRQRLPWKTYLAMNAVAVVLFTMWALDNGWPWMVGALVVLVVANAFGLLVGSQTKWIGIEHLDESGQPVKSFFADRSAAGWGGIFGGTQRLHDEIRAQLNTQPEASEEKSVNK